MALTSSRLHSNQPPADLPKHLDQLKERRKYIQLETYALDTEMYMRPALSFGCLCFIMVACPVGIWFSRSDYLSSFITCFLPIVFIYYPLMLCGTNLAKEGKFHPALAVWAADLVMAVAGVVLFRRLLRN
jgi:lipopolysaccharide export system permease protein